MSPVCKRRHMRRTRRNGRHGQDRGYTKKGQERPEHRLDREGDRGIGADRQEVSEDGGPVAGDAEEGAFRERADRALCQGDRCLARQRHAQLAQAAPHRNEGAWQAEGGARLRRLLFHRAAPCEGEARGDGRGARPARRAGLSGAQLACRRMPGRLRRGGLQGEASSRGGST